VKLLDVNLLLYAINEDAPHHEAARDWLQAALSGTETIGLTWPVLLAFLRLSTRVAVFPRALQVEQAVELIDTWLAQPCVVLLHPTPRHWSILRGLITSSGAAGNLTSDAHLAAMAVEHGAELCSTDHDFARFTTVRWLNPIATA
jgi:toxin-antitoxin system PIN domain toxin